MEYSLVIEDVITTTCANKDKSRKYNVEQKKPDTRINAIWFHLYEIQNQAKLKTVFRNAYLAVKL